MNTLLKESQSAGVASASALVAGFDDLFEHLPDALFLTDRSGRVLEVNAAACHLLQKEKAQIKDQSIQEAFATAHRAVINRLLDMSAAETKPPTISMVMDNARGVPTPMECSSRMVQLDGQPAVLISISQSAAHFNHDLDDARTIRMLSEVNRLSLDLSATQTGDNLHAIIAERLKEITGALLTSIAAYDAEHKVILIRHVSVARRTWKIITKFSGVNLRGIRYRVSEDTYRQMMEHKSVRFDSLIGILLGAVPDSVSRLLDRMLGIGATYGLSIIVDGRLMGTCAFFLPERSSYLPMQVLEAFSNVVAASFQRIEAMNRIRKYQEELRQLATDISLAEERERRHIAQALHDDVTQTLALASLRLSQPDPTTDPSAIAERYREVSELLDESIEKTRNLTFEISPPILYELGLKAAIEWLAEKMTLDYHIACRCDEFAPPSDLPESARVLLFQIIRELLVNVRKHARATEAIVRGCSENGEFRLSVADNGAGMNAENAASYRQGSGYGLFSIRERVRRMGGTVNTQSAAGRGTEITICIPSPELQLFGKEA